MSKHTPGTWIAEHIGVTSLGPDGVDVYEVIAGGRVRVAEGVSEGDARLIAAAPDLLEALQSMTGRKKCGHRFECICPGQAAIAAIAKATGEA